MLQSTVFLSSIVLQQVSDIFKLPVTLRQELQTGGINDVKFQEILMHRKSYKLNVYFTSKLRMKFDVCDLNFFQKILTMYSQVCIHAFKAITPISTTKNHRNWRNFPHLNKLKLFFNFPPGLDRGTQIQLAQFLIAQQNAKDYCSSTSGSKYDDVDYNTRKVFNQVSQLKYRMQLQYIKYYYTGKDSLYTVIK
ncbi:Hypothetical_protein [Hexamita inflata]|uniref:Hypothetical_protein n=1 Tax=Hexamita inflata TaxID=28002 RepID=A0ABP1HH06_9EUKA